RTGLIVRNVSLFVREDDSVGGAQGRKAQGIRGSACGNRKRADGRGEVCAQTVIEAARPGVVAVGLHQPVVRFGQGGEDLRGGGPCVVTEETHSVYPPAE